MHDILKQYIKKNGPIAVQDFLEMVLYHPIAGYYSQNRPSIVGAHGDFITAPEISQLFGETLGIAIIHRWQEMGCPKSCTLVECGPGNGTLMADLLRTFARFPDFIQGLRVYLVEVSEPLRDIQQRILGQFVNYVSALSDISELIDESDRVLFFIGNEYFDALPIQQMAQLPNGSLEERTIDYDEASDHFYFTQDEADYRIIEKCPLMMRDAGVIKTALEKKSGMGIFIDYGYTDGQKSPGNTLQAVMNHQKVDVFDSIGKADISHQVDFGALEQVFAPLSVTIQTQRDFLMVYGIVERLEQLARTNPQNVHDLATGVSRLLSPTLMGEAFKVLIVKSI